MFHCPSRRAVTPYPRTFERSWNAIEPPLLAKAYNAGNGSSQLFQQPGPPFSCLRAYSRRDSDRADTELLELDGLTTAPSKVKGQQIPDRASNTSTPAEKFLNPDHVEAGKCGGDNNWVYNANH